MSNYQPPKAITVTNESCWHVTDMIPNPPKSKVHDMVDKVYTEMSAENKHNTEIIMAHEFREHPEGYKDIAQTVVDAYNEANTLSVGGKLPDSLDTEKEE